MPLPYHEDTALLIDRMCAYVERADFELHEDQAAECILKTYDLFDLPRPKKVVWVKDITDKKYQSSASSARSAWSASSARSAWFASSASSASSALDYDFNWFVYSYEYTKATSDNAPNQSDQIYLTYCELLLQALEHGAGYRVEWEDTLYIAPTPIVKVDSNVPPRFHSETGPAVRWKDGWECHYLRGEYFDKALWQKIVDKSITATEVMKIADSDKRTIAISMLSPSEMIKQLKARLIDTGVKGTKLYQCDNFMKTNETEYFIWMQDASTPREFIEFVPPDIGKQGDAELCQAAAFGIPLEDWLLTENRG